MLPVRVPRALQRVEVSPQLRWGQHARRCPLGWRSVSTQSLDRQVLCCTLGWGTNGVSPRPALSLCLVPAAVAPCGVRALLDGLQGRGTHEPCADCLAANHSCPWM